MVLIETLELVGELVDSNTFGGGKIILASVSAALGDAADTALAEASVEEPGFATGLDAGEFKAYLDYLDGDVADALAAARALQDSLSQMPTPAGTGLDRAAALERSVGNLIERLETLQRDIQAAQKYTVPSADRMDIAQKLFERAAYNQNYGPQNLASLANTAKSIVGRTA